MSELRNNEIAIIGMAGVFPGAKNIEEFRENLIKGVNSITSISEERLAQTTIDPELNYRKSGFLDQIEHFDNDLFGISFGEAKNMDPHQRKILEQSYAAIENAGYNLDDLKGTRTAVYLSDVELHYFKLAEKFEPTLISGNFNACTAAWIARFFDFRGAAAMIDTSCSSSLMCLHMACKDLILNEADYGLIGGVNISIFPAQVDEKSEIGIVSENSLVSPFSKRANGTVFSEAVVCFLVKRAEDAIRDNDSILAIIKSTAVNQDAMTSASLTAPSATAQANVLINAWKKAGIKPEDLYYLETHGTGTKLGDPIEIDGIQKAINSFGEINGKIPIGSVKSNVGHTVGVAGATGLVKIILGLKNKELYPTINFDAPNPLISFEKSGVFVNLDYKKLSENDTRKLVAGISSFGMSGTNVHVVVEEGIKTTETLLNENAEINYCFSAQSEASLNKNIKAFCQTIIHGKKINRVDACYTLLTGRKHYDFRATLSKDLIQNGRIEKIKIFENYFILFPPFHSVNEELLVFLKNRFKLFSEKFEGCIALGKDCQNSNRLTYFSYQYALFFLFKEIGLPVRNLIGFGDGKLVAAVLLGKSTLKQAIASLNIPEQIVDDSLERLQNFFIKSKEKGNSTFIEIGAHANLSKLFEAFLNNTSGDHVFSAIKEQAANGWEELINSFFKKGYPVNWKKYFSLQSLNPKRIHLPGYQFEEKRCWLTESKNNTIAKPISQLIHTLDWAEECLVEKNTVQTSYYAFIGDEKLWLQLVPQFQSNSIQFNFYKYDYFLKRLRNNEDPNEKWTVIDGRAYEEENELELKTDIAFTRHKFVQEILKFPNILNVAFVNKYSSSGSLTNSTVLCQDSLLKSAFHEYRKICFKNIHWYGNSSVSDVINELKEFNERITCVFWENKRFVPLLKKSIRLQNSQPVKAAEHYVIIGGTKGIGYEIAFSMAKKKKVKLTLIGRSDKNSDQVKNTLLKLKEYSSHVTFYSLDVSKKDALFLALTNLGKELKIDGVIFSAGQLTNQNLLDVTYDEVISECESKVNGIQDLNRYTNSTPVNIVMIFSSILAVTSAKGLLGYTIANAYINDYAKRNFFNQPSKVINWSGWKETGLLANNKIKNQNELTKEEGLELFWELFDLEGNEFFISKEISNQYYYPFFKTEDKQNKAIVNEQISSSNVEEFLSKEISKLLGIDRIESQNDFFDLGLHSLNGSQIVARLKSQFGIDMDFYSLYNYPTIAQLSKAVNDKIAEKTISNHISKEPEQFINRQYDLSYGQLRIWLSGQVRDSSIYNIPGEWIIEGDLKKEICEQAFKILIDEQSALRIRLKMDQGIPKQVVSDSGDWKMVYSDLSRLNENERLDEINKKVIENKKYKFNIYKDNLFRFEIAKLDENKFFLAICLHHLIADGWSIRLLLNSLLEIYKTLSEGKPISRLDNSLQFAEYAELSSKKFNDGLFIDSKNFFANEIKLCYQNPLPFSRNQTYNDKTTSVITSKFSDNLPELSRLAKEQKVTLFIIVVSAFKCLLRKWTGGNVIPIGIPETGRFTKDQEQTVGNFIKELPFVSSFTGEETFLEYTQELKNKFQLLMKHKEFPFEALYYEELKNASLKGDQAVYDIMFTWNQFENQDKQLNEVGLIVEQLPDVFDSSNHIIWLIINVHSNSLEINLICKESYLNKNTAEQFSQSFHNVLNQIVKNPTCSVDDIEVSLNANVVNSISLREELEVIWRSSFKIEPNDSKDKFFQLPNNEQKLKILVDNVNKHFKINIHISDVNYSSTIIELETLVGFLLKQRKMRTLNDKKISIEL